ncbi:MAG: class I SAM-dependent methyltransferase [Thermoleophilaceae bacterium]|nr:class I SAM-dependent methyltransferase [Thermoleophilaceae bacterium]
MPSGRAGAAVAAAALAGALGIALWWRRNPSPCPYAQRFWVELPHPSITRERLEEILAPRPGERVLEVGPGTGYYTLGVARRLGDDGRLHILDVQDKMLEHTCRRAREAGLHNVVPVSADARDIPYDGASFDAAYVCAALGEVPDVSAALRELRRVVRPGGQLVVGESYLDPHLVRIGVLRAAADAAGLALERRSGGVAGYFARFEAV